MEKSNIIHQSRIHLLLLDLRYEFNAILERIPNRRLGLCSVAQRLYEQEDIKEDDYHLLQDYLRDNLPTDLFKHRYEEGDAKHAIFKHFCWDSDDKDSRRAWMDEHINLTRNEQ